MNELSIKDRAQIIMLLAEGNSIRATARIADVSPVTVLALLKKVGPACQEYHNSIVNKIDPKQIQCDEIWSFVYAKDKNVPEKFKGKKGFGDMWTWIAMDSKTKFVTCWITGTRGAKSAKQFIKKLSEAIKHRFQLTSDGHKPYIDAVEKYFGASIDYAQNHKIYKSTRKDAKDRKKGEHQFTPERCVASHKKVISGTPNPQLISTSHIERQNFTVRTFMRRFTRATNGFSKKYEFHVYALALQFTYYNFCRIHTTLRVTPAIEAGVVPDVWSAEDIVKLAFPESNQA